MRFGYVKATPEQEQVAQIFITYGDAAGNVALAEALTTLSARDRLQFTHAVESLVGSAKEKRLAEEKRILDAEQTKARLEAETIARRNVEADKARLIREAATRTRNKDLSGLLVVLLFLGGAAALIYGEFVPGSFLDSAGLVSHSVDTSITAQANWLVGETKTCESVPDASGYAFSEITCDEGPKHNIKVKFYGMRDQPGKIDLFWNCTKSGDSFMSEEGFVCKQMSAIP